MNTNKFEAKMIRLAKLYQGHYELRNLQFGYRDIVLKFDMPELLDKALLAINRMNNVHYTKKCFREGTYEGRIYIMTMSDYTALEAKLLEQTRAHDDWWMRYHLADPSTRKKMACGELN